MKEEFSSNPTLSQKKELTKLLLSDCDPDVLSSMYAAFPPSREVNTFSWDIKMHFWTGVLSNGWTSGLLLTSKYSFRPKELQSLLSRNGVAPMGLNKVLLELWESGEIFLESSFLKPTPSKSAWLLPILTLPFRWIISLITTSPSENTIPNEPFIALKALKKSESILAELIKCRTTLSEKLLTKDEFLKLLDWSPSDTEKDLQIILHHAHSEGLLQFDHQNFYIKLCSEPFSDIDINILTMKTTIQKLHQQIEELECKIQNAQADTRQFLNEKKKSKALLYLRRKKLFEPLLDQRLRQLSTLESIIVKIDTCETEAAIMLAYQTGTATLTHMLSKPELELDHIHSTMRSLQDLMLDHKEIDNAMRLDIPLEPVEVESLERELMQLTSPSSELSSNLEPMSLSASNENMFTPKRASLPLKMDDIADKINALPSVPSTSPQSTNALVTSPSIMTLYPETEI